MTAMPWEPAAAGYVSPAGQVELLPEMRGVEMVLAEPASGTAWCARIYDRLVVLRAAFAQHIRSTEGAAGWYAEVLAAEPRLAGPIGALEREHRSIAAELDALCAGLDAAILATRCGELLHRLSGHRQRDADLLYEAYDTDLGGET